MGLRLRIGHRAALLGLAISGSLGGCAVGARQQATKGVPAARQAVLRPQLTAVAESPPRSPPLLVLREGRLASPAGAPLARVHQPVLVQPQQASGSLRDEQALPLRLILPGGGFLQASWRPAGPRQALGLYARRKTRLFREPGRHPLGVAHPGAFLPLASLAPRGGRWQQVAVPLFGGRPRLPRCWPEGQLPLSDPLGNQLTGELLAWVELADLGLFQVATPASDPWVPPLNQRYRLRDAPGGEAFMTLQCGPFRVLAEREDQLLLAQLRQGIELYGWLARSALLSRGSSPSCMTRTEAAHRDPPCVLGSIGAYATGGVPTHRGRERIVPAGLNNVVLGPRGAVLLDQAGHRLGWLPAGSRLQARTRELTLAARDSSFSLGRIQGRIFQRRRRDHRPSRGAPGAACRA